MSIYRIYNNGKVSLLINGFTSTFAKGKKRQLCLTYSPPRSVGKNGWFSQEGWLEPANVNLPVVGPDMHPCS